MDHCHQKFQGRKYLVIGNPISHSLSPIIQQQFAQQTGQTLDYQTRLVAPDGLADALAEFLASGIQGANITLPFKQQAWQLLQNRCSARTTVAGAVNTIWRTPTNEWFGDTTDGIGLQRDLQRLAWPIKNQHLLVLGAGGAVRSILPDLLAEQPAQITLVNRDPLKAQTVAEQLVPLGKILTASYKDLAEPCFDIIINGTSASTLNEIPALPSTLLHPNCYVYDLAYRLAALTPFLQWAKQFPLAGTADGLGMLVEQAAESFYLWHGIFPETEPVLKLLRK